MALISWNQDLSVNIQMIDKQHQKLVAMLNELNDAMRERKSKEILGKTIANLADYALTHFMTEERLFDKHQYPHQAAHKQEHNSFAEKVAQFKTRHERGEVALSIEMMIFLKDWLINHIQGSDKKYGPFLNERGLY